MSKTTAGAEQSDLARPRHLWLHPAARVAMVVLVALAAHAPAVNAVFLFDTPSNLRGVPELTESDAFQQIAASARPLSRLTFAINRTIHDLEPMGYHVVNMAIHIGSALLMMALVGGLLRQSPEPWRRGAAAVSLAAALVWAVHPLTTSAVAYTIQRDEALMALFYLATLLACLRCATTSGGRAWAWGAGAVVLAAMGMGAKQVMITVPAVALLMDRCFVAEGWLAALRQRGLLYLGLVGTWAVLWQQRLFEVVVTEGSSAGFGFQDATPWQYAMTQPGIILHYFRLAFSPYPLVLDYHWLPAESFGEVAWAWVVLGAIGVATLWALWRVPRVGFSLATVFIILSPTSSFVPTADLAFEHRFYLPLAAVIAGLAALIWWGMTRYRPETSRAAGVAATAVVVAALGVTTFARNLDYTDGERMWGSVIAAVPYNARAMHNLGRALWEKDRKDEAFYWYQQAADLWPRWPKPHYDLGRRYLNEGYMDEAMRELSYAVELQPNVPAYHKALAQALMAQGQWSKAAESLTAALDVAPDDASLHRLVGVCYLRQGDAAQAATVLQRAVELDADAASAWNDLGVALEATGDMDGATAAWRRAVEADASGVHQKANLGRLLAETGQWDEAEQLLAEAHALSPHEPTVLRARGRLAERRGDAETAIDIYQSAVASGTIDAAMAVRLTWLLATAPASAARDIDEAGRWAEALTAVQEQPSAALLATVAAVRARQGHFDEAARLADAAAARATAEATQADDADARHLAATFAAHAERYRNNQPLTLEVSNTGLPMPDQPQSWPVAGD